MKITAYIPVQFYNYEDIKIDTKEKLLEHLFLPPEDFSSSKKFHYLNQNRNKLTRIPIYLDKKSAEFDSTFFTGAEEGDYGKVLKVSINIEEVVYNQLEEEKAILNR